LIFVRNIKFQNYSLSEYKHLWSLSHTQSQWHNFELWPDFKRIYGSGLYDFKKENYPKWY
jgi:hypothetical protein